MYTYPPIFLLHQSVSEDHPHKHKTMRDVFIRFSDLTSVQGIPFINRGSHWYTKAIWTFLFLAAVAAWLYHSYMLIYAYISFNVTTRVGITHDTLPFPSVTICNINPLQKTLTYKEGPQELVEFLKNLEPAQEFKPRPGPGQGPNEGGGIGPGPEGPPDGGPQPAPDGGGGTHPGGNVEGGGAGGGDDAKGGGGTPGGDAGGGGGGGGDAEGGGGTPGGDAGGGGCWWR